jgi:hypothetical protein
MKKTLRWTEKKLLKLQRLAEPYSPPIGFSFPHSPEAAPEPRGKKPSGSRELGKEARSTAGASLQRLTKSYSFSPRGPSLMPSIYPARNVAPTPAGVPGSRTRGQGDPYQDHQVCWAPGDDSRPEPEPQQNPDEAEDCLPGSDAPTTKWKDGCASPGGAKEDGRASKKYRPCPTAIPGPPRGTVLWARHETPSAYSRSSPQGFDAALPTRGRTTTREPEEGISFTEDFPESSTTRTTTTLPWRESERVEKEVWRGPTPLQSMQVLHSDG